MNAYIDQHRDTCGGEPLCKVLQVAPSAYRCHAARQRNRELRSPIAKRDELVMPHIERVRQANLQVYGADKVWKQMNREDIVVARGTVARLMRRLGLRCVRRGKTVRTTVPGASVPCPLDRGNRQGVARWIQSVGSKGDRYDNALAEIINGLYKAELIHRRGPWRTRESVELATLEWVSWFNLQRLMGALGYILPAEAEADDYSQLNCQAALAV